MEPVFNEAANIQPDVLWKMYFTRDVSRAFCEILKVCFRLSGDQTIFYVFRVKSKDASWVSLFLISWNTLLQHLPLFTLIIERRYLLR